MNAPRRLVRVLVNDLVDKEKAGVNVRVIVDAQHKSVNGAAFSALSAGGVGVTYSSSAFLHTHQKTITVDGASSYVSTGPNVLSGIEAAFNTDFDGG